MSTTPTTTSSRPPLVPVVAAVLGLAGIVGAAFTGWIALFAVYGLSGGTVGLEDGSDWIGFLMALACTALLLAGAPLVMGIGWRSRGWLVVAGVIAALVIGVGLAIALTAG